MFLWIFKLILKTAKWFLKRFSSVNRAISEEGSGVIFIFILCEVTEKLQFY